MEDPLKYTYDGIERELNLLEIHLKEAPEGDEAFCSDCINKHISTIRGFALEGTGFTNNEEEIKNFLDAEKELRKIKGKDYKKDGVKFSQKVREIRKKLFSSCPECEKVLGKEKYSNLSKHLNNPNSFKYQLNNKEKPKMADFREIGMTNVGQFAAEGVKFLQESADPTSFFGKNKELISIGGGVGLQAVSFLRGVSSNLKKILIIAGSNLFADGVVELVAGGGTTTTAVSRARRAGKTGIVRASPSGSSGSVGKSFSGSKVTASKIPTQHARAGVLSGAQAFESPEHADLIRVD